MPFSNLIFDNRLIKQLPADIDTKNYCRSVNNAAYSYVQPTTSRAPSLIAVSQQLAKSLGFTKSDLHSERFSQMMTGNLILAGMTPYSLCYGGHQFGQWAGQLGDGRAINLGELSTATIGQQTLQLKGAGKTPYSRNADGKAVLRSSIREFLCSEAMFHLHIPTTRALSLCFTGEETLRDMMYDGNPAIEPCAVVCRVSSSFLRFGSIELPASRGEQALVKQLVEFCINNDFKHLRPVNGIFNGETYLQWFSEVCERTAELIVHWMRVGFVHGVMNTDNMSLIGETIDYGPYGWIDNFDLNWTANTSDAFEKRYRFGNQAQIGQWNLAQLANAILPLIGQTEPLQAIIDSYAVNYQHKWAEMMTAKLGLQNYQGESDLTLFHTLEKLLGNVETDMPLFYRTLAKVENNLDLQSHNHWLTLFTPCYYNIDDLKSHYLQDFKQWLENYLTRINCDGLTQKQRAKAMNQVNPKYVLRNYLAQQAVESAEQGDFSEIKKLQTILQNPYQEQEQYQTYAKKRPDWARNKVGCSLLSCSS